MHLGTACEDYFILSKCMKSSQQQLGLKGPLRFMASFRDPSLFGETDRQAPIRTQRRNYVC